MNGKFRLNVLNKVLSALLCMIMLLPLLCFQISAVNVWDGSIAKGFGGGKGTPESPYLISNAKQLALLAGLVNGTVTTLGDKNVYRSQYNSACYALTADIYLNDLSDLANWSKTKPKNTWTPIGYYTSSDAYAPFCGSFDGKGYSIYGLYISSEKNRQGLFGCIEGGTVSNVSVKSSYIKGSSYVGGIAGYVFGSSSAVIGCFSDATVSGNTLVGGIAGASSGAISSCKNSGTVSGKSQIGGIVGGGENYSCVMNSLNTGSVSGSSSVGGILGYDFMASRVIFSVNTGHITGSSEAGAIAGNADGNIFYGCYYLSDTASKGIGSATETSSTVKLTAAEIKTKQKLPLLDFKNLWVMSESSPDIARLSSVDGIAVWNGKTASSFAAGSGSKTDPYKISSAAELAYLSKLVSSGINQSGKYFVLTADITFNNLGSDGSAGGAVEFLPIGNELNPFCGTIDGKDHTISGLFITGTGKGTGLFGCSEGTISNIKLNGGEISGGKYVGALVGINRGTVSDCSSSANVTGSQFVGGLVGRCESGGKITGSETSGTIRGCVAIGGIAGGLYSAEVEDCVSKSSVHGAESVGGVAGYAETNSTLSKLKNEGSVFGSDNLGGICGQLYYYSEIELSQNIKTVSGRSQIGGILGYSSWRSSVKNCLNDGSISGKSYVAGIAGYIYNNSSVSTSVSNGKINSTTPSGIVGESVSSSVSGCYYTIGTANGGIAGKDVSGKATSVKSGAQKTDYSGLDFALSWTFTNGKPELQVFTEIIILSSSDISSTAYNVNFSSGTISKIPAGTTLSQLKKNLKVYLEINVFTSQGNTITDGNTVIPTGSVLTLTGRNGALTLVVTGDLNGDGKATITDFIQIKSHLLSGGKTLTGFAKIAADVNFDSSVSITDFVRFKSYLLGKSSL